MRFFIGMRGVGWCVVLGLAFGGALAVAALPAASGSAASAAEMARAEEIVQGKCFMCHGIDGESSSPLFPRLAGQHAAYVARQLAVIQARRR